MYDFHPYYTNDGSVGLYSPEFNDIYHSASGALTEAYEKFILPVDMDNLLNKDSIKILDICYGIGYNSKSFLNYFLENKKNFSKKIYHEDTNIAPIDTNNIKTSTLEIIYNRAIYTYNKFVNNIHKYIFDKRICIEKVDTYNAIPKLYIKAVDSDKILAGLSPFIKTGEKNFNNRNIDFDYKKIEKYLNPDDIIENIKIDEIINFVIFNKIAQKTPEILLNPDINGILNDKRHKSYFSSDLRALYHFWLKKGLDSSKQGLKGFNLHNIYYRYITERYKRRLKTFKLCDIDFELKIEDARKTIIEDNNSYDLIFLDAFTPSKCPCLWSYEFFIQLFSHLEDDGMILTYSLSPSIRSAMLEAGFEIGNIYNKRTKSYTGTIAAKNKSLIKHPLSEYDLGLLKTSAGIFYRDKNLTGLNEAIRELRNSEIKSSNRISVSKYKKQYKEDK